MADDVIREGKWRCPNCRRLNRGAAMKCDGCGQTRGDVPFIYDEGGALVDDAAGVAEALAGPDWVCACCATSNPHAQPSCRQCGSPRDGADRQRRELTTEDQAAARADLAAEATAAGRGPAAPEAPAAPTAPAAPPVSLNGKLSPGGCCGCVVLAAGFVFLMGMLLAMCGWLDVDMTVTGLA